MVLGTSVTETRMRGVSTALESEIKNLFNLSLFGCNGEGAAESSRDISLVGDREDTADGSRTVCFEKCEDGCRLRRAEIVKERNTLSVS